MSLADFFAEFLVVSALWLLDLPFKVLRAAWWFLAEFLPAVPGLAADFYAWLVGVYYWLFPWVLRAKERREKAELLISYEELVKKREELWGEFEGQAELLEDFSMKIRDGESPVFRRRLKGETAESLLEEFPIEDLLPYEEIQEKAVDYENTLFRIFTVCQKLKLYGINRGIRQYEPK